MWHAGRSEVDILRKYRQKRLKMEKKRKIFHKEANESLEFYVDS